MKLTWKTFAVCVAATVAFCSASVLTFAQDASGKFAELAPKMTAQNMEDEGQVREMENAQQTWMFFCLQDGAKSAELRAETNKLMLDAIAGDYPVPTKAWLLHILQWVGDDSCVDGIAALLKSDQPALVDGAARALAQIPTDAALDALKKAQGDSKAFESYIKARNVDVSVGKETESPLALPNLSDADFAEYMKGFDKLSNDDKARALTAVRVRKAKDFAVLAVANVASENQEIKRAALLALEKIGTGKEFDVLFKAMKEFDRGFVIRIMKNIPGEDFDAAVVAALKAEKDEENMKSLAEIVGGRYISSEVGALLAIALNNDCPQGARLAILSAAEQVATKANISDFVNASLAISDRGERDRAEQIVSRLCKGDASPVVAMMNNENGAQILLLLGRIGGDAALAQIERAIKSNEPQAVALGVRALCNWPNAVVWEKLLAAAQEKAYPEQLRIQALRAFIRVVSLPDDQDAIDMSGADKLKNLKKAMELATRDDERNLVLERVGSVRELDSVKYALEFVDNEKLSDKAINAILDLAHQDYLRKADKALFIKALDVVLEKGNDGQKDRAGNYKSNIR